ncbi:hypothetical protein ACFQZC_36535 [Streptacidiphilus monticola]
MGEEIEEACWVPLAQGRPNGRTLAEGHRLVVPDERDVQHG